MTPNILHEHGDTTITAEQLAERQKLVAHFAARIIDNIGPGTGVAASPANSQPQRAQQQAVGISNDAGVDDPDEDHSDLATYFIVTHFTK